MFKYLIIGRERTDYLCSDVSLNTATRKLLELRGNKIKLEGEDFRWVNEGDLEKLIEKQKHCKRGIDEDNFNINRFSAGAVKTRGHKDEDDKSLATDYWAALSYAIRDLGDKKDVRNIIAKDIGDETTYRVIDRPATLITHTIKETITIIS